MKRIQIVFISLILIGTLGACKNRIFPGDSVKINACKERNIKDPISDSEFDATFQGKFSKPGGGSNMYVYTLKIDGCEYHTIQYYGNNVTTIHSETCKGKVHQK